MRRPAGSKGSQRVGLPVAEVIAFFLAVAAIAYCAENPEADRIPPLLPPRAEMPPEFWEMHGWSVVAGVMAVLGLVAVGVWWLKRPRAVVLVPAADQARQALELLSQQSEAGLVLTGVARVVRGYFASVFGLPSGELTTGEFTRALAASDQASPDLAAQGVQLLRACDERKFALVPPAVPLEAVSEALQLIERLEARRLQAPAAVNPPMGTGIQPQAGEAKPSTSP